MFYGSLVFDYFRNYMKTKLTYRADFWIELLSDLLFQGMNLFFILIVFQHTKLLGGFTLAEILFIYGYFMVPYGIFNCFLNLWGFAEKYITKGEMDRILTRPAFNLGQLMLENMDPASLFGSLVGLIIMVFSWPQLHLSLTWYDPFILLLLVLGSSMIYAGVYIFLTSLAFFSDAPTGIAPLIWNIQNYGRYPVGIYNKLMKNILTWVLPFAFTGYYPAAYFLHKTGSTLFAFLTPAVGVVFLFIALTMWNYGVRKYQGAGS